MSAAFAGGARLMTADRTKILRRIEIDRVSIGMYLEDVFDKDGVLLLSANAAIQSEEQITRLRARGVYSVYINIRKGKDIDLEEEAPDPVSVERERAYYEELARARVVHQNTIISAKEALQAARAGRPFSINRTRKTAEEIVESILRNPDALVSLSQIKGYDEYTFTHSVNVGILVTSLAREMGYEGEQLVSIGLGGLLHDIGKMRVPENVLNKPGRYTDVEFRVMKRHPDHGLAIVGERSGIAPLTKKVIGQHHERYDGSGYPKGLIGDRIDEAGVIGAVADVYDALTSDRVYRSAWTPQKALATIFQGCDRDYSRRVVELFTRHLGIYPVGSFVKLQSGEMGVVIRVSRGNLLAPIVLILFDKTGKRITEPLEMNLAEYEGTPSESAYRIEMSLNPKAFRVNIADYIQDKATGGIA
ncbi:MAG: HD domain-containing protein [Chitinivibrionales bacterium]|nr:HD domain-containing protein [Chitinivibrionales bacterium]MBD3359045.1 HD domain-containing protein [Chitinivibrionales bacterium]